MEQDRSSSKRIDSQGRFFVTLYNKRRSTDEAFISIKDTNTDHPSALDTVQRNGGDRSKVVAKKRLGKAAQGIALPYPQVFP